jgi:FkbM family methyltransferase
MERLRDCRLGGTRMIQEIANRTASFLGHESRLVKLLRPTYESALNGLAFGRGVQWSINGIPCRIDARFRSAMGKNYDSAVAGLLSQQIQPGATCYNVGANLGVYVIQFAHWSGPNGRVVAFEPNPSTVSALRRHIDMNALGDRVTAVPEAVSNRQARADFYAADYGGMSRLGAPNRLLGDEVTTISVPVTTIDAHVEKTGLVPDVMFVDVEGFEMNVLDGARRTLQRNPKMLLLFEMHPNVWESAGTDRSKAVSLLAELKLSIVPLMGQSDPYGEYGLVELRTE